MQEKVEDKFSERHEFSDEATFHTNGKVNGQCLLWGEENPHATIKHKRDSANVLHAISKNHVHGPFFVEENATGDVFCRCLKTG